jgi:membrane-associated phospholipid phosphatase
MSRIISKHPWQDISSMIWLIFIIGLLEIGSKHFWVVMLNLAACFLARKIISAKRPVEYDSRLQPLTDVNAESFGFPSIESYMSVVIMGHIFIHLKILFLLPLVVLTVIVIGISRIYSRSRFPHQILGSYLLGVIGLQLSINCCEIIQFHK